MFLFPPSVNAECYGSGDIVCMTGYISGDFAYLSMDIPDTQGYGAIGFGSAMSNADVFTIENYMGNIIFNTRRSASRVLPPIVSGTGVLVNSSNVVNARSTVNFTVPLLAQAPFLVGVSGGVNNIIFAFGDLESDGVIKRHASGTGTHSSSTLTLLVGGDITTTNSGTWNPESSETALSQSFASSTTQSNTISEISSDFYSQSISSDFQLQSILTNLQSQDATTSIYPQQPSTAFISVGQSMQLSDDSTSSSHPLDSNTASSSSTFLMQTGAHETSSNPIPHSGTSSNSHSSAAPTSSDPPPHSSAPTSSDHPSKSSAAPTTSNPPPHSSTLTSSIPPPSASPTTSNSAPHSSTLTSSIPPPSAAPTSSNPPPHSSTLTSSIPPPSAAPTSSNPPPHSSAPTSSIPPPSAVPTSSSHPHQSVTSLPNSQESTGMPPSLTNPPRSSVPPPSTPLPTFVITSWTTATAWIPKTSSNSLPTISNGKGPTTKSTWTTTTTKWKNVTRLQEFTTANKKYNDILNSLKSSKLSLPTEKSTSEQKTMKLLSLLLILFL